MKRAIKMGAAWFAGLIGLVLGGAMLINTTKPVFAGASRLGAASARVQSTLAPILATVKGEPGRAVFIRIIKSENILELWIAGKTESAAFSLLKSYPICSFSGVLGPKTREGDMQAPEGVYEVAQSQLNPFSQFHLSFNLGYPNAFDRAQGYTGSALMVHGNCVSIGCYAMTDPYIEEIYWLMSKYYAANPGAKIQVQALPFRLTTDALALNKSHPALAFWQTLAPIYQAFETTKRPPKVKISSRYTLIK